MCQSTAFVEAAKATAIRTLKTIRPTVIQDGRGKSDSKTKKRDDVIGDRIDFIFQLATSRSPDSFEQVVLRRFYQSQLAEFQNRPEAVKSLLRVGHAPIAQEYSALELATWTAVSRAILNLSESMTRP